MSTNIQFRCSAEFKKSVTTLAERAGTTVSDMIKAAIIQYRFAGVTTPEDDAQISEKLDTELQAIFS